MKQDFDWNFNLRLVGVIGRDDDCVFDAAGAGAGEDAGVEAVGADWIRGVGRKNFDLDVVRRVFEMELSHATAADDQFG